MQYGCVSTTYQTHGVKYSHVCGRVKGYQDRSPDAFKDSSLTIDSLYIWTFAAAVDETRSNARVCPCTRPDLPYTGIVPPLVGQDYFCADWKQKSFPVHIFCPDDPLWDGQGCGGTSTCYKFNNPSWFCKQLPQPTTDDIELRICVGDNRDTPISRDLRLLAV